MFTPMLNNNEKSVELGPLEQKVYFGFYDKEVFRVNEVYKLIDKRNTARQVLFRLKEKGYVKHIKRGLYAIIPAHLIGKDYAVDKILIASNITEPYFLSHHTALELHGIAESFFNTAYISTSKNLRSFRYQGIDFKIVTTRHLFGITEVLRGSRSIKVSDRERTVLDCIRNMDYAGGLEEILKSITGFPSLDYEKMYQYLELFDEISLFHRTGFLMDFLRNELDVQDSFLNRVKEKLSTRTYYLGKGMKGKFIREWNVIVPRNLEELIRFA